MFSCFCRRSLFVRGRGVFVRREEVLGWYPNTYYVRYRVLRTSSRRYLALHCLLNYYIYFFIYDWYWFFCWFVILVFRILCSLCFSCCFHRSLTIILWRGLRRTSTPSAIVHRTRTSTSGPGYELEFLTQREQPPAASPSCSSSSTNSFDFNIYIIA